MTSLRGVRVIHNEEVGESFRGPRDHLRAWDIVLYANLWKKGKKGIHDDNRNKRRYKLH